MANVVTKLIVDSQEYDNKIKRAAEGLQHYAEACKKAGGTLEYVDEEAMAFARDLGKMDTVATNAKSRMREYADAIATATVMYRQMSDAEKQGDFGKALSASISELKIKAADLKDVIADTNVELRNLSSDTNFTDGLNLMTRTLGASMAAITAWTGESKEMDKVIKDLAKIGTTVAAVDALTKAFQKQNLVLLKNPYVLAATGVAALAIAMGKLIKKSQELSQVEKDLQEVQKKGRDDAAKEITRIQTLNRILHDNTRSMEDRNAALKEIKALVPEYHGALTTEGKLINDNKNVLDDYTESLLKAATAQAAFDKMVEINKQKLEKQLELGDATTKRDAARSAYQEYKSSSYVAPTGSSGVGGAAVGSQLATEAVIAQKAVDDIQSAIDEYDVQLRELQELVNSSALGTQGGKKSGNGGGGGVGRDLTPLQEAQKKIAELSNEALTADDARLEAIRNEIAGLQEQVAIYKKIQDYVQGINQSSEPQELNPDMPGPKMTDFEKLQQSLSVKLADSIQAVDMNSLTNLMTVAIQNGINGLDGAFEGLQYQLAEGLNIPDEAWKALEAQINEMLAAMNIDPITIDVKTGNVTSTVETVTKDANQMKASFVSAASAVSAVGSALQQIDDPAAKIAGIVAQAVANIALGFAAATASPATTAAGVFGWIAAATTGLATMIATISSIKSVTSAGKFANGGVVGGNS